MLLLFVPVALLGALFLRLYRSERSSLRPVSRGYLLTSTRDAAVPGLQDVTIPVSRSVNLGAWYIPPRHGAAVIVAHGTGADRSTLLAEVRILSTAGIGVLAFDWPGHGTSSGRIQWGEAEREALGAAVTWLSAQSGVDAAQLGVLGFSFGGYIVSQRAAVDQRIRRIALLATPSDATEQTYNEYAHLTPVAGWLAMRAIRMLGVEPDSLKARDMVGKLAPRPLLIVTGSNDPSVPTEMADTLFAHAGEPKTLLRITTAQHGHYVESVDSARYAEALRVFFAPSDSVSPHDGETVHPTHGGPTSPR